MMRNIARLSLIIVACGISTLLQAQNCPTKAVHIVVPSPLGGYESPVIGHRSTALENAALTF